jgi:PAS domain S-box-containing protein
MSTTEIHDVRHYERLLEKVPGFVFVKDRNSCFIDCNGAFAEFAGETRDSIVGKSEHEMPWADEAEPSSVTIDGSSRVVSPSSTTRNRNTAT